MIKHLSLHADLVPCLLTVPAADMYQLEVGLPATDSPLTVKPPELETKSDELRTSVSSAVEVKTGILET
jgi:hypothetical protein